MQESFRLKITPVDVDNLPHVEPIDSAYAVDVVEAHLKNDGFVVSRRNEVNLREDRQAARVLAWIDVVAEYGPSTAKLAASIFEALRELYNSKKRTYKVDIETNDIEISLVCKTPKAQTMLADLLKAISSLLDHKKR